MKEHYPNPYHNPDKLEALTDHQLFHDVFNLQAEISKERYDSIEEAQREGVLMLKAIHELAEQAGLFRKEVTMTGFDILVPLIGFDSGLGTEVLRTDVVDASNDPNAECAPIRGEFYGFHPIVTVDMESIGVNADGDASNQDEATDTLPTDEEIDYDEDKAKYRIDFHYRVCVDTNFSLGNYTGMSFAMGRIGETQLEFAQDKRTREAAQALNALADESHSVEAAMTSAKIDELLTAHDGESLYTAERLNAIGETLYLYELHHGVNLRYRDAILDLVAARLGLYPDEIFSLHARSAFLKNNDTAIYSPGDLQGEFKIHGIEFSPLIALSDENDDDSYLVGNEALSIVVPGSANGEDMHSYIPFQELVALAPYEDDEDDDN